MIVCVQNRCPLCEKQKKGEICEIWSECSVKILGENSETNKKEYNEAEKKNYKTKKEKRKELGEDYIPIEEEEQIKFFDWCCWNKIEMIHIPNERKCTVSMGERLKKQGVRKGFPDNFLPYQRGKYHGLFIEMKRAKKTFSTVSSEQKEWQDKLKSLGYAACICYGADEAIQCVTEYLNIKKK